ncbi:MAG: Fe-S metabolism protein SufE [Verrucomicrobiales bacterium]|nr:Fe-S metabolism protein SufE [Verrucomicrobiales bacterium]
MTLWCKTGSRSSITKGSKPAANTQQPTAQQTLPEMIYPGKLQEIIATFEPLCEEERRENLVNFALGAGKWEPAGNENFDIEDIRKDEQCIDTVGIHLRVEANRAEFRITLGPNVQTMTRAMTTILCQGLDNCDVDEILRLQEDFIEKIVGTPLVTQRGRTIYYILYRMKDALEAYLEHHQTS